MSESGEDMVIGNLGRRAEILKAEDDEHQRAKARKTRAEDEILCRVVEAIKPALPALSSRVQGVPAWRGVNLDKGKGIYLGEHGDFFATTRLAGGASALDDGQPPFVLSPADVLDHVSLVGVVATLFAAIDAQLGKRAERIKQIDREAALLEGILQAFRIGGVK